jgi:hypothetical protein
MNSTSLGNALRDEIAELFRLAPGYDNVQTEYPVGSQAVDVYYEEPTSTGVRRVACECKNYRDPLTRTDLEKIYAKYEPLRQERLIDDVRVIAPLEPGVTARRYLADVRFSFATKNELEAGLIDFRSYVRALHSVYEDAGLDKYYVRPVLNNGIDLEGVLTSWMGNDDAQPIAILAGYGMGKTSLARRFAHVAATEYERGQTGRIPILIPLAEISSEQDLEGLLGKLFTAHNVVRNFQFPLFMALNSRGRFLIILDGFDEMKHTMTWREFKYNITQLHRLVAHKAKVLLLGRPSALISELEEVFVLRGSRLSREREFHIPGAPEYRQLQLQPFSAQQAFGFIERYASYQAPRNAAIRGYSMSEEEITRRIDSVRDDEQAKSLVERPVHAKMMADLALDPKVEWRSFNRYELYEEFVARIINRENLKTTRQTFGEEQRQLFAQQVAWWLWQKGGTSFEAAELPKAIIQQFTNVDADSDAVTRDLVAGSLLERKTGGKYYFPHRSFLEFLVARHIASNGNWKPADLEIIAALLNVEVAEFLKEAGQTGRLAAWGDLVDDLDSAVPLRFFELVAWSMNQHGVPLKDPLPENASRGSVLVGYLRLVDSGASPAKLISYLVNSFRKVRDQSTKLLCLVALLLARAEAIKDFRARIGRIVVALVLNESLPLLEKLAIATKRGQAPVEQDDPFASIATFSMSGKQNANGPYILKIRWPDLYNTMMQEMPSEWRLTDPITGLEDEEQFTLADLSTEAPALKLTDKGVRVIRFFDRLAEADFSCP